MHNVLSGPIFDLFNLFVFKFKLEQHVLNHNCSYILLNLRINGAILGVTEIREIEEEN